MPTMMATTPEATEVHCALMTTISSIFYLPFGNIIWMVRCDEEKIATNSILLWLAHTRTPTHTHTRIYEIHNIELSSLPAPLTSRERGILSQFWYPFEKQIYTLITAESVQWNIYIWNPIFLLSKITKRFPLFFSFWFCCSFFPFT